MRPFLPPMRSGRLRSRLAAVAFERSHAGVASAYGSASQAIAATGLVHVHLKVPTTFRRSVTVARAI